MQEYDFFLGEEDFREKMEGPLAEFRAQHYKEGMFLGMDNHMIHYVYLPHPEAKAIIVVSHGFCEFIRKYDELLYYFYQAGYSVYMPEHMGHGMSYRNVEELDKVHADSFKEYVEDFRILVEMIHKEHSDQTLFFYGHSMGGGVGALFLEQYPGYFKAAVLSSPMLQVATGKCPGWAAYVAATFEKLIGNGKKYAPGKHGFDDVYAFSTSSMLSEPRYAYIFKLREDHEEFQMYGATMGWLLASLKATAKARRNAKKVEIPVLLCQAGRDHMVGKEGQELFAEKSKNTTILRYPEAKHEIFNSMTDIRNPYYCDVLDFYEEQLGD